MIVIKNHTSILFKIDYNDFLKEKLDKFFTVINKEYDADQNCKIEVPEIVTEFDDKYIYIPISIAEIVCDYLSQFDLIISDIEFDDVSKLETPKIYEEFYSGREGQLEYFNQIKTKIRGEIQLPTGFGKTEVIKGLADSLVEDGNILIIAPISSICEEIYSRLSEGKTGKIHNLDKVRVINPVGHVNSYKFTDPEWIKWMNEVKMILVDEAENINDSLKKLFDEQLTSFKYCYGFSASADKFDGKELKANKDLTNFTSSSYGVVKYIGLSLVYKKPTLKLNLNIIQGTFGSNRCPPFLKGNTGVEFNIAIRNIIYNENFEKCLKLILENKKDILFIPVQAIKHGEHIKELINKLNNKLNVIQWNASEISGVEDIVDYDSLKLNAEKVDVIIATKIAFLGVDIPRISDVLLLVGTQYNTIVQPIGRAFRHSNPSVWLIDEIYQKKNNIYKMCHYRRVSLIKRTYDIGNETSFNILN